MSSISAAHAAAAELWQPSVPQLFHTRTADPQLDQAPTGSQPPPAGPRPSRRSRRHQSSRNVAQVAPDSVQTYGYHQSFHTHSQPQLDAPPSYESALRSASRRPALNTPAIRSGGRVDLPAYSCTVERIGIMAMSKEFSSPFLLASDMAWDDVFVVLRGTVLSIHRIKFPHLFSRRKQPEPGKLIRSYTLQHAEVGVAADFKRTELIPKHPLAHLVPPAARAKVYETDPHLFEPVREHVLRLRAETEQFLLCANSLNSLLSWVESICAAIDISLPLEERSEPRYRSLPRRSRRHRTTEARLMTDLENIDNMAEGRRLVAEQERILRELYPHLAGLPPLHREGTTSSRPPPTANHEGDPEEGDLDRADVAFPSQGPSPPSSANGALRPASATAASSAAGGPSRQPSSRDPKTAPHATPSASQRLRYRRRCAPILLFTSARTSDVVMFKGKRMRIDGQEATLKPWQPLPPRYEAHGFPKPQTQTQPQIQMRRNSAPIEILGPKRLSRNLNLAIQPAVLQQTETSNSTMWCDGEDEITPAVSPTDTQAMHLDRSDNQSIESAAESSTAMTRSKSQDIGNGNTAADADIDMSSALAVKKVRSNSMADIESLRQPMGGMRLIS